MTREKSIDVSTHTYHHADISREEIRERLRLSGYRITKQRETLLDIILSEECACCKEIYYTARKTMPDIGIATIYRMLSTLEDVGAIKRDNMYRICCQKNISVEKCRVELDNHAIVELDEKSLQSIIQKGMEKSGYLNGTKVINVVFSKCENI